MRMTIIKLFRRTAIFPEMNFLRAKYVFLAKIAKNIHLAQTEIFFWNLRISCMQAPFLGISQYG